MSHSQIRRLSIFFALALALTVGCKSDEEKSRDFLARGDSALEAENPNEAIIEYRNVIQIDPNHPQAHYGLAKAYLQQGNLKGAYWELSESVRLDPANLEARKSFGGMSIAARDFDQVLEQADALIQADPEDAVGYHLKAQALDGQGTDEEAEEFHLKAIEKNPEEYEYLIAVSKYYARQTRFDDAEEMLKRYTELDPGSTSYSTLGRFYTSSRRFDDAESAFKKAIEVEERPEAVHFRALASLHLLQDRRDDAIAVLEQGAETADDKSEVLYDLAKLHLAAGRSDEAEELLVRAAAEDPDNPRPQLILSEFLGTQGDLEGALAAAAVALESDPNNTAARMRTAEILIDQGYQGKDQEKIAEAEALVNEVLAVEPTDPDGMLVRSKLEMARGETSAAVASLQAAVQSRPNWAEAHLLLGSALALAGDPNSARMELARALELDGQLVRARGLLAQVHSGLGEHEYAVEQGRLFLQRFPDEIPVRILVAQSLVRLGKVDDAHAELQKIPAEERNVEAMYAIGRIQMARGEWKAARENLLKVNELQPNEPDILRSLVSIDIQEDKADEGVARIDAAVESDPSNARLLQLRAQVALSQNDSERAEESLRKAIEINPDDVNSYRLLAGLYQRQARFDDTIATYEAAVEIRPDAADMLHFLGVLYEHKGESDTAMGYYEKAISYDANLGDAKNNLAYLLAEKGTDLDRALDLAQEAKALMPDNPNASDTLGWVLYKRGVTSAAVGYLQEAEAGMDPNSQSLGIVRYHLARAYETNQENEKALASLDRALADFEKAKSVAKERDVEMVEPTWVEDVRVMRGRLKGS